MKWNLWQQCRIAARQWRELPLWMRRIAERYPEPLAKRKRKR